ncbi:gamma-glutamyltransferase, partial [Pseudomonas sp. FW306-2-2C-D06B]|uniref:gamma-glutamyltransferase n=1 Tax=Pseudomonas sp. FW306-2-2C-D06B TaxID=2070645 RepID=UPI000CB42A55
ADGAEDFRKDAPTAAIFLKAGRPYAPGERLVQTDLARSLQAISDKGPDAFYRGAVARQMVAASRSHGGLFTLADFAAYKARE